MEEECKYKVELKKIKNYITLFPNEPKYKVSATTGISLEIIDELIEEGYLEEREGELKTASRRGRMRLDERSRLINGMGTYQKSDIENPEKLENSLESKLVSDLRKLKNDFNHNIIEDDDFER